MTEKNPFRSTDVKLGFVVAIIALPFTFALGAWVADTELVQRVTSGSRWSVLKAGVIVAEFVVFVASAAISQSRRNA
jgi:hypothetical protein